MKFLGALIFFESLEDSPQIFRHCEEKTIDGIVIPYYPKAFRYHKISETQGSPYEIFRYCETKRVDRIVIPILSKKSGNQKFSGSQSGSPMTIFGDVRQKNSKNFDTPIIEKILIPEHFWNTEGSPTMFFGILRPKNFDG